MAYITIPRKIATIVGIIAITAAALFFTALAVVGWDYGAIGAQLVTGISIAIAAVCWWAIWAAINERYRIAALE